MEDPNANVIVPLRAEGADPMEDIFHIETKFMKFHEEMYGELIGEYDERIIPSELIGKIKIPATFIFGVLAKDWAGMSNSILGIINQVCKNVLFIKAFTVKDKADRIGIVII